MSNFVKNTFCLAFIFMFFCVYAQNVSTVAGILSINGAKDGQSIAEATFNNPHGIAVSKNGEIYIADRFNHLIRKIDTNGIVTTLAGTGVSGSQDGIATNASFNEPWGLVLDTLGNVYVADTRNNKIRKIDTNGIVTTFAGTGNFGVTDANNPLAASFGNPTDLIFDSKGNLIIADHLTHLIRKISKAGVVSTLAGNKSYPNNFGLQDGFGQLAKFNRPYGIDIDKFDNIYVADEWNHAIRKINNQGFVITLAGNGAIGSDDGIGAEARLNFPFDLAIDSSANLYVADGTNYTIRKLNLESNELTSFVGMSGKNGGADGLGNQASFNGVTSVAFAKDYSALFASDPYNHIIRKIDFLKSIDAPHLSFLSDSILFGKLAFCQNKDLRIKVLGAFDSYDVYVDSVFYFNTASSQIDLSSIPPSNYGVYVVGLKNGFLSQKSNTLVFDVLAVNTTKILSSSSDFEICQGDSIVFFSKNKTDVYWSDGSYADSLIVRDSDTIFLQSNANICYQSNDSIIVKVYDNPIIEILTSDSNPDFGDTVVLKGSGAENYFWGSDGRLADSILVYQDGSFSLSGIDNKGCKAEPKSIQVKFNGLPSPYKVRTPKGIFLCENDVLPILSDAKDVIWYYQGSKIINVGDSILYAQESGSYYYTINEQNGTINYSDTVIIQEIKIPTLDVKADYTLLSDVSNEVTFFVNTEAIGIVAYDWHFMGGETPEIDLTQESMPKVRYKNPGLYGVQLEVEFDNGCKARFQKEDWISYESKFFIASAFTPNQDLINDQVVIRGVPDDATLLFLIFNEWGELVFESKDTRASWDGVYKDKIANAGNYSYLVDIQHNGNSKTYKGIITLIK